MDWGIVAQRYPSGAVTVGFGTCQWGWVLDATHDRSGGAPHAAAQQFTANLLADLGAPPASLMAGLVAPAPVPLGQYFGETEAGPRFLTGDGRTLAAYRLTESGLSPLTQTLRLANVLANDYESADVGAE